MKYEIEKTLLIKCTLDSSELIMFNKGGKYQVQLDKCEDWDKFNKITLSVQLEKGKQSTFNHTFGQGQAHRAQYDKIHAETKAENERRRGDSIVVDGAGNIKSNTFEEVEKNLSTFFTQHS